MKSPFAFLSKAVASGLLQRLVNIENLHWSQSIPEKGYDDAGNLLEYEITNTFGRKQRTFAYDHLYQQVSEKGEDEHSYAYDSLYNRIEKNQKKYRLNSLNQLLGDSEATYLYDLNGNMRQKNVGNHATFYTYDAMNRLTTIKNSDKKYVYTYDAFSRRLTKMEEGKPSTLIKYIYQGLDEMGALDASGAIIELRILDNVKRSKVRTTVAIELQDRVFAPIHDNRGNIVCLIDADTGEESATYQYSSFGEESGTSRLNNPWRFAGKRTDPETGFIYYGKRYYDPKIGRWVTPDPLGLDAGPNLYTYVYNNPLIYHDSYGEFAFLLPIFALAFGVGEVAIALPTVAFITEMAVYGTCAYVGYSVVSNLNGSPEGGVIDLGQFGDVQTQHADEKDKYKKKPGPFPGSFCGEKLGDDPTKPPREGMRRPGKDRGSWVDEITGETLYPDFNHKPPIEAHWDYESNEYPEGVRLYLNGEYQIKEPKNKNR